MVLIKRKVLSKKNLDDVLDSLQLERTVYHSGALIGNDVNKLVKKENIKKLCHVFEPKEVMLNNG